MGHPNKEGLFLSKIIFWHKSFFDPIFLKQKISFLTIFLPKFLDNIFDYKNSLNTKKNGFWHNWN